MCKPRRKKVRKPRRSSQRETRSVSALLAAAATLPGVASPSNVNAQSVAEEAQFRFQYSYYEDRQSSGDRITVKAPMAWVLAPVGESTEIEASFVLDTISGASPLYHDTLSGASGVGIQDERWAGDAKVTEYFEDFSLSVGTTYSKEDDYRSVGGSLEGRVWNENKSTTVAFGISGNADEITSSNEPNFEETSDTVGGLIGVTQVINKHSLVQSNITYSTSRGYLSDPYKAGDSRPDNRDKFAWLTRYVLFVPELEGSLHCDYRYYRDSWGVMSHTFDTMWYQPLDEVWMLRPHVRLYSQSKADFYSNFFPNPRLGEAYSADQRLAGFGEVTTGAKLIRKLGDDFSLSLGVDFIQQRGEWKLGSEGSPNLEHFRESVFSIGFQKKF